LVTQLLVVTAETIRPVMAQVLALPRLEMQVRTVVEAVVVVGRLTQAHILVVMAVRALSGHKQAIMQLLVRAGEEAAPGNR
jgi:hypothetical protein